MDDIYTNLIVGCKYKLLNKIGMGAFGQVYLGEDMISGIQYAVKIERLNEKTNILPYEAKVYKCLQRGEGIPALYYFGVEKDLNIMVIDLLGPSIEDLLTYCDGKFSLKTTLMLADQFLKRIVFLHKNYFVHRDLKPDNFLIGNGPYCNTIYAIDFGLSKRYKNPKSNEHIPYKDNKMLTGTIRYASINTHLGIEQSRRDDLESLAYILIQLLNGKLPWQGLKGTKEKEKFELVIESKLCTSTDVLCVGLPKEFSIFLKYVKNLKFEENPDYFYLHSLFNDLFLRMKFVNDGLYDWIEYTLNRKNLKLTKNEKKITRIKATDNNKNDSDKKIKEDDKNILKELHKDTIVVKPEKQEKFSIPYAQTEDNFIYKNFNPDFMDIPSENIEYSYKCIPNSNKYIKFKAIGLKSSIKITYSSTIK